jgi:hypothetical protein
MARRGPRATPTEVVPPSRRGGPASEASSWAPARADDDDAREALGTLPAWRSMAWGPNLTRQMRVRPWPLLSQCLLCFAAEGAHTHLLPPSRPGVPAKALTSTATTRSMAASAPCQCELTSTHVSHMPVAVVSGCQCSAAHGHGSASMPRALHARRACPCNMNLQAARESPCYYQWQLQDASR